MKVLVVNKFYWNKGGSERVMFDLNRGFEARGHGVVPFSMKSEQNVPSEYAKHFVSEIDYGQARGLAALKAAGRALYSREAKRKIRDLIREARPDVAHLHNFHHQLSPSIVDAPRDEGVPSVFTVHDYKPVCPNYLLYTQGEVCERCSGGRFHNALKHRCVRDSYAASLVAAFEATWHGWRRTLERGVRFFVSPSRFLARKLTEFGVPEDQVRCVPNGLDPTTFPVATEPGEGFLYCGRLSREKGVLDLLAAIERLPETRLTITGTGPQEAEVEAAAQRIGDRVELTGFLSREDLMGRIRASRAVVVPSVWYENAPLAVLEALACGVPVIGADIGGIPELVRDGETGLLFPPGDVGAMSEQLRRLQGEPELAAQLGRRARATIEAEYTSDRQIDAMLDLFRRCA